MQQTPFSNKNKQKQKTKKRKYKMLQTCWSSKLKRCKFVLNNSASSKYCKYCIGPKINVCLHLSDLTSHSLNLSRVVSFSDGQADQGNGTKKLCNHRCHR